MYFRVTFQHSFIPTGRKGQRRFEETSQSTTVDIIGKFMFHIAFLAQGTALIPPIWLIHIHLFIFIHSMMFGVGTDEVRLHANKFVNLLGEDENGWGMSHKGLLWHAGIGFNFTKRNTFPL